MIVRTCFAASLAALTMLVCVSETSAKPGSRASGPSRGSVIAPGARIIPGTRVIPGPARVLTPTKTLGGAKTLALKPAFVKAPATLGGKTIKTSLYAGQYGVKTKGGFVAYKGKGHGQWSRKWFNARLRCWQWYCPSVGGWFYWCGGRGCYLPLRYMSTCAPTVAVDGVPGDLPPGAETVPTATGDELPPNIEKAAKGDKGAKNDTTLDVPEPE